MVSRIGEEKSMSRCFKKIDKTDTGKEGVLSQIHLFQKGNV